MGLGTNTSSWVNSTTATDLRSYGLTALSSASTFDLNQILVMAKDLIYAEYPTLDPSMVAETDAAGVGEETIKVLTVRVAEGLAARGVAGVTIVTAEGTSVAVDENLALVPWIRRIFGRYRHKTESTTQGNTYGTRALLRA